MVVVVMANEVKKAGNERMKWVIRVVVAGQRRLNWW